MLGKGRRWERSYEKGDYVDVDDRGVCGELNGSWQFGE